MGIDLGADQALEQLALGKRKTLVLFAGEICGEERLYFGNQGQWLQNDLPVYPFAFCTLTGCPFVFEKEWSAPMRFARNSRVEAMELVYWQRENFRLNVFQADWL
jgi:hypothetical protein